METALQHLSMSKDEIVLQLYTHLGGVKISCYEVFLSPKTEVPLHPEENQKPGEGQ